MHFFSLSVTTESRSSLDTGRKYAMWFLAFFKNATMSSRYTKAGCHFTDDIMTAIARENVACPFFKPNSICTK